jgi:hypothetical protein
MDINIVEKIGLLYKALHNGEQLTNSQTWSSRANSIAIILIMLESATTLASSMGYDLKLEHADLEALATGIGAVGFGLVSILHTASNKDSGK